MADRDLRTILGRDSGVTLPPGQRAVDGFPRFGAHLQRPPPAVPATPAIEITGAVIGKCLGEESGGRFDVEAGKGGAG